MCRGGDELWVGICALEWSWVMVLYVYFFKQKTSYEMRISDCSSDVCSSDLPIRCRDVAGVDDYGCSGRWRRLISAGGKELHERGNSIEQAIDLPIGRASCRERVCPYV